MRLVDNPLLMLGHVLLVAICWSPSDGYNWQLHDGNHAYVSSGYYMLVSIYWSASDGKLSAGRNHLLVTKDLPGQSRQP